MLHSHLTKLQSTSHHQRVLGVMTGTSLDGVDLCLVDFEGSMLFPTTSSNNKTFAETVKIIKFETLPYPKNVLDLVESLLSGETSTQSSTSTSFLLHSICELNTMWSREIGKLINEFLKNEENGSEIVIASHGQTIWHISGNSTLQIGDSEVLSQVTNRIVVSNFRAADVAVGGCGAPLVPFLDRYLAASAFKKYHHQKISFPNSSSSSPASASGLVLLQNLGGIGNVSLIFVDTNNNNNNQNNNSAEVLTAFDTGPANVILNELFVSLRSKDGTLFKLFNKFVKEQHLVSHIAYDKDGEFSSSGRVMSELLEDCITSEYFEVLPLLEARNFDEQIEALKARNPQMTNSELLRQVLRSVFSGRSTGREDFGSSFVSSVFLRNTNQYLLDSEADCWEYFHNLCATAAAFTSLAIARHLRIVERVWNSIVIIPSSSSQQQQQQQLSSNNNNVILLCSGGGSMNQTIMNNIRRDTAPFVKKVDHLADFIELKKKNSSKTDNDEDEVFCDLGDAKEAIAFAFLGHEKMCSLVNNTNNKSEGRQLLPPLGTNEPDATGASKKVFLGQISVPN